MSKLYFCRRGFLLFGKSQSLATYIYVHVGQEQVVACVYSRQAKSALIVKGAGDILVVCGRGGRRGEAAQDTNMPEE